MKWIMFIVLIAQGAIVTPSSAQDEDPTQALIKQLTKEEPGDEQKYCNGNPPGQDDAWCSWVCIDGKWSKVCR